MYTRTLLFVKMFVSAFNIKLSCYTTPYSQYYLCNGQKYNWFSNDNFIHKFTIKNA